MVRKGGFEPPRLSAPPPQDGVSASSTTSARCKLLMINDLASFFREGRFGLHAILHRPGVLPLRTRESVGMHKQLPHRFLARMYVTHSRFYRIVSGCVLQRERVGVLTGLGEKRNPLPSFHPRCWNQLWFAEWSLLGECSVGALGLAAECQEQRGIFASADDSRSGSAGFIASLGFPRSAAMSPLARAARSATERHIAVPIPAARSISRNRAFPG